MKIGTKTKVSVGFKTVIDILAAFQVTPQPGVPLEEAGATESSTVPWATVWTGRHTSLDPYKGRCYLIEPDVGEKNQYIAYVAYTLDLFEKGSIVGSVFGFKSLRALHLEDVQITLPYSKTFQGPPHGIQVERDILNKYGHPLLGCTIKPILELSAKNYTVYECLPGGLEFPWMMRTGNEIKGHYLNAIAGIYEEMIKRVVFAREMGFAERILGHPWGNAPSAIANWVALDMCIQACNEVIREASQWNPKLAATCEIWKEIKFEFEAMDVL
ncbi:hypothetical protein AMTRI_Chr11g99820 [Amborella trichopoda]